jgi:YggT family protein
MFIILARVINLVANLLVIVIIANSVLSFFVSPYHPVRVALDRILAPLLNPIRKLVPLAGMFDFSPLILIILIQILSYVLTMFLYSI